MQSDNARFCRTIREIRRDMHKQREWRNELEKMKIGNVVGSLSVESKTLRASLIPVTQRTLEQVGPALKLAHTISLSKACHIQQTVLLPPAHITL